eukprot:TRINITY_DN3386_c0_g1_i1.p1 TRINITY_DN3386_c0_g1~~TRINITY_DN3386_c0_g1_i1.p1  ORF type:complete len:141 (+),score=2.50 TRINITY_DN3386_c0_g1_i1:52-474(+)
MSNTIAIGCVVAFYALAYLPHMMKHSQARKVNGYDNSDPRSTVERLQALRADPKIVDAVKRYEAAHNNSLENFAPFAAAVILALIRKAPMGAVNNAAMAFVGLRIAYLVAVSANAASLRSLIWTASVSCIGYLYYLALKA